MNVKKEQLLQDGGAPEYMYRDRTAWHAVSVDKRYGSKGWISTKKCCPCTVNIARHVKQSTMGCRNSWKGGEVSKMNIESVGLRSDGNHKNFSRDLWNGGTSV